MAAFKPPEYFTPGENPAEAWERWRQRFEIYYEAANMGNMQISQQRAILLHVIGEVGLQLYFTLDIPQANDERTVTVILNALSSYYRPYRNTTFKRHEFFNAVQAESMTIDEFVTDLKLKARNCDFGELTDSLVRDRLVCGLHDKTLKTQLLREHNLTLASAIDICRAHETSVKQGKCMNKTEDQDSHVVESMKASKGTASKTSFSYKPKTFNRNYAAESKQQTTHYGQSGNRWPCSKCGSFHKPRQCPAFRKRCYKCHRFGHFGSVCKTGTTHEMEGVTDENTGLDDAIDSLFIGSLTTNKSNEWTTKVLLNGESVELKLDTGANVNILPMKIYSQLQNKPKLNASDKVIRTYSGHHLQILGKCTMNCSINNVTSDADFYVVKTDFTAILGLQTCEALNLISRLHDVKLKTSSVENLVQNYNDVFEGIGEFKMEHTIRVSEEAVPKVSAPRMIPISLRDKVKQELDRMENLNIITRVTEPTKWVHPMVVVNKPDGSLRICLDPRPLNQVIMREHYPLPNTEDLLTKMKGAKYFIKLDARSAFWQIPLSEESSYLTTFATPFGRFRFLRLPYGLASAPEVFQRAFSELFSDLDGIVIYMDDLLIWGSSIEELYERFEAVLKRARDQNIKFSKTKLKIGLTKVEYIGHELSADGIRITPARVEAIKAMEPPTCKKELQSFLGTLSYLSRFIDNLSSQTAYLRSLLQEKSAWIWDAQAEAEFQQLKKRITEAPLLRYFDPEKPVTISVDASEVGIGSVLMQENLPVAYGSSSLTDTQSRYAPIERELLAIVHGLEHFHYYIYGQNVTVKTDHKPLLAIVNKPYSSLSPRIQRMVLRLQRYQFKLEYVPGKEQYIADMLSRKPNKNSTVDTSYIMDESCVVHLMLEATPTKLQELRDATAADPELKQVKFYVQNGWPRDGTRDQNLSKYWTFKDEIYESDGLLFKDQRIIIPRTLQQEILQRLHKAHQGIVSCKNKARESIYWTTMNKDIEQMIQSCHICQSYQPANQKEPLQQHDVPKRPWEKIGADFMKLENKLYLVIIDYFSKYIEVLQVSACSAIPVTNALKSVFARYGIPNVVFTDNGPPFNSSSFQEFCKEWQTTHQTSSPMYPKSNGMIERSIQTVKALLVKTIRDKGDIFQALLEYRATPHNGLPSPATLMMGRRIRTTLPMTEELLKPKFDTEGPRLVMLQNQQKQKEYSDRNSRTLEPLKVHQPVLYFHSHRNWLPAVVEEILKDNRSYIIKTAEGARYRRNRVHLRPRFESAYCGPRNHQQVKSKEKARGAPVFTQTVPWSNTHHMQNHLSMQPSVMLPTRPPEREITGERDYRTRSGRLVKPPIRFNL